MLPAHIGPLLPAEGATGIAFTTTRVVPIGPGQPLTVAVTEYVPAANNVALAMDGFCNTDEKAFGPVQEYVAPAITLAERFKGEPTQTGLLLPAVGAIGAGFITTVVVPAGPVHPATVAVTE